MQTAIELAKSNCILEILKDDVDKIVLIYAYLHIKNSNFELTEEQNEQIVEELKDFDVEFERFSGIIYIVNEILKGE